MLEVIPLATAEFTVGGMVAIGATPRGNRLIGEVSAARVEGERLSARLAGHAAADWALARPDGVVEVDVRLALETDDGAFVYLTYDGNLDPERGDWPVLSMMKFETGDERYAWLNRIRAVGKGQFGDGVVRYEIFELR
ncbi:MAG: DUF3237 domain-containing protein [Gemmatimonadota bacterium]